MSRLSPLRLGDVDKPKKEKSIIKSFAYWLLFFPNKSLSLSLGLMNKSLLWIKRITKRRRKKSVLLRYHALAKPF